MRVISGSARGTSLTSVPSKSTRPITDRVKEALFNILGESVYDTFWLDLFAGTGAVGIEALSRGAEQVLFTEINYRAYKTILQNLEATDLSPYAIVKKIDAFVLLHGEPEYPFDFIYIAPPQYKSMWLKTMQTLDKYPAWLATNGQIIVQIHPKEWNESIGYTNFTKIDQREYGDTRLIFFEKSLK